MLGIAAYCSHCSLAMVRSPGFANTTIHLLCHTGSVTMYKKACIFALALVGADAFAPMPPIAPVGSSRGLALRTASQTVVMGTFIEEFKYKKIANRFTFKVHFFPLSLFLLASASLSRTAHSHSRTHAAMSLISRLTFFPQCF
jgi:hypothetical protein